MITALRPAAGLGLLAVLVLTGCQPERRAAPAPTPTPAATVSPRGTRVGFVDLAAIFRAHRRWPEMDALLKKMDALQVRLSSPPPPPEAPPPAPGLGADLQAEAERLQAAMRAELVALEEQMRRRLEAFVSDVKAEQEGRLAERHRQINADLQRVVEARRDELQRELERFELATMAEYRIPLLNLRLKGDVVGVASEEEARRLNQEGERITRERDGKIRTKAQAAEKALQEFLQARTAEAEAAIKALIAALEEDANARLKAKQDELNAELQAAVRAREATLNQAVEERRKLLVGGVDQQMRAAQQRYARRVEAEAARLRQELDALAAQRFRLEDSLMAEINIEIATLAQDRKIDVVLSQVVASATAIDLTRAVIARLRRP